MNIGIGSAFGSILNGIRSIWKAMPGLGVGFLLSAEIPPDYRGIPFDDAAYRAEQRAEADRPALPFLAYTEKQVLWNSRTLTNGVGTVEPSEAGGWVSFEEAGADDARPVHFHAATPNYRPLAFHWHWSPTAETGVRGLPAAALSFSLKVVGPKKPQELFVDLGEPRKTPVSIRPFEPSFADGSWHRITIPFRALKNSDSFGKEPWTNMSIRAFVWNPADFDLFIDSIALDVEVPARKSEVNMDAVEERTLKPGQVIPGRLECAFYDLGGEGVAYHDTTPINTLSAVLNQQAIHQRPHATAYHWNFRRDEGVDISYVKDFADLNHTNSANPPINQLYIGGTEDGEWCNYTVEVKKAGAYRIVGAYGNIAGMKPLRFSIDGKPAVECPCPVVTAGMHRWTREEIGTITFPEAGRHLLTLFYQRGYNLGYFDFQEVK